MDGVIKTLNRIKESDYNDIGAIQQLNKLLYDVDKSEAHHIITKYIDTQKEFTHLLKVARKKFTKEYQRYQNIKIEAKETYAHDITQARMIDVDRAASRVYAILVNMIGTLNKILMKQGEAINKIEELLGLDVTNFIEEGKDDTTRHDDVQGDKSTPD